VVVNAARPRLALLAAAALFSTGGAAIKATHLSGWQVACFRSAVAVPALLLLVPAAWRSFTRATWLVGAAYAATVLLFVLANKLTTSASTIFLQSTAPLYLLLIGPLFLKEPVRARDLLFMAALAAGLALLVFGAPPPTGTAPNPSLGNVLAAASGLSWALTLAGLRSLASRARAGTEPAAAAAVAGNVLAALVAIGFALPLDSPRGMDLALIVFLGVVQIGCAYALVTRAMHAVPAFEASLLLLLEPVLNPVWAFLVHGESLSLLTLAGAVLIVAATAWHSLVTARDPSSAA
jgi:drug/metabolite transporter (DMT)-like permease